jgi:CDP-6-deoxy-D-xylo-4-hexulose-3-dehydrase
LKEDTKFTREEIMEYLNKHKIWTRLLFSWNFTKQPAFLDYVKNYRIVGDLKNTDYIMSNTFWLGTYPGLTQEMLEYIILHIKEFVNGK